MVTRAPDDRVGAPPVTKRALLEKAYARGATACERTANEETKRVDGTTVQPRQGLLA
jgi:hypothetical protein